jgi:hypothetical protein
MALFLQQRPLQQLMQMLRHFNKNKIINNLLVQCLEII